MPPESHAGSARRKVAPPVERKAYHMIVELLELVPKKHHVQARRLAEELFRHGGELSRRIWDEEV
jgi:hypothetical protein